MKYPRLLDIALGMNSGEYTKREPITFRRKIT
jgi:hypothetical protein